MIILTCIIFLLTGINLSLAELGFRCITPNNEDGICWPIQDCDVIKKTIEKDYTNNEEFVAKSNCGYLDTVPLVCCGSWGYFKNKSIELRQNRSDYKASVFFNYPKFTKFLLAEKDMCGYTKIDVRRIIGGDQTKPYEFPWMVLLRYKKLDDTDAGFKCSGTIINNQYILTAAHCVKGGFEKEFVLYNVRLGEWDISSSKKCVLNSDQPTCNHILDCNIMHKIVHPFYNKMTGNNDIALIKLQNKFEFTMYIRPICIQITDTFKDGENILLTVAGWGKTDYFGEQSDVKRKVNIPLVTNSDCAKKLQDRNIVITANMICAGGESGKDACSGDSGGPLMYKTGEVQWFQVGIISKGIGCGMPNIPAIYTRVSRYFRWIINNIKKYEY